MLVFTNASVVFFLVNNLGRRFKFHLIDFGSKVTFFISHLRPQPTLSLLFQVQLLQCSGSEFAGLETIVNLCPTFQFSLWYFLLQQYKAWHLLHFLRFSELSKSLSPHIKHLCWSCIMIQLYCTAASIGRCPAKRIESLLNATMTSGINGAILLSGKFDVRSASRVGYSDLGVNMKRLEYIAARLEKEFKWAFEMKDDSSLAQNKSEYLCRQSRAQTANRLVFFSFSLLALAFHSTQKTILIKSWSIVRVDILV